jgi:hypothetical protein
MTMIDKNDLIMGWIDIGAGWFVLIVSLMLLLFTKIARWYVIIGLVLSLVIFSVGLWRLLRFKRKVLRHG